MSLSKKRNRGLLPRVPISDFHNKVNYMLTTSIYNASSTTNLELAERNINWRMENFHPKGFFTNARTQDTLHGLFAHTNHRFEWVSEGVKFTRGLKEDGSTKYVPYNYQNLLQFYSPYLLYCFWDEREEKIIQIDSQFLPTGFRYRHLTIPQFNSYLFDQHQRAFVLLRTRNDWEEDIVFNGDTPKKTLIQKVFNTKWTFGLDIFPIACSQKEIIQWMPHFNWFEEGVSFPTLTMEPGIKGGWKPNFSFQSFPYKTQKDMPVIVETFEELIGKTFTPDELHEVLDQCDYRKNVRKGRITTATRLLKEESIELSRFKKKVKGVTLWFYRVSRIELGSPISQSLID